MRTASGFRDVLETTDELRALYRRPNAVVEAKKTDHVDETTARFIAVSPFVLVATSDPDGSCDVSPRGGPPGFVRVLDEHRHALPDLGGNNLLDSITNILANPHIGLLFVRPGTDETLRVDGRAVITTDPRVLDLWDGELRRPKAAIGIEVEHLFIHCAKAFRRGEVWHPDRWNLDPSAPDASELFVGHAGLDIDPAVVRKDLDAGYEAELAGERISPA
ncbi:MAG: MSMEG_1061 family FMN-dependent PPOX-type flavoprotein [Actinomycetota bacterium]|nr:MSMEG_1061 family FMN-dependent PPOX-type flavoprotein [Actinomycetota bacterium]